MNNFSLHISKYELETRKEINNGVVYKRTEGNGAITMFFISEDCSSYIRDFQNAAEYLNDLLEDGYKIVNTVKSTIGNDAGYNDSHKFVVFEDGKFKVGSGSIADLDHYNSERIEYTLAKKGKEEAEYKEGDKVKVIKFEDGYEYKMKVVDRTIEENLGGFVKFKEEETKYELNNLLKTPEELVKGFNWAGHIWTTVLCPNEKFHKEVRKAFQKNKEEKLKFRIKKLKKELEETKKDLQRPVEITYE